MGLSSGAKNLACAKQGCQCMVTRCLYQSWCVHVENLVALSCVLMLNHGAAHCSANAIGTAQHPDLFFRIVFPPFSQTHDF